MALTFLAEVVGTILIVAFAPLAWSTRLIAIAVYLGVVHSVSRVILRLRARS